MAVQLFSRPFILKILQFIYEGFHFLGPFVAAGERIGYVSPLPDFLQGRRSPILLYSSSYVALSFLQG